MELQVGHKKLLHPGALQDSKKFMVDQASVDSTSGGRSAGVT